MTSIPAALSGLKAALATRDRSGVNRAARDLIRLRAPLGGQWRAIATVLIENGELSDARRAIDLLAAATGHSALGRFAQAEVYAQTGRLADAQSILASVPADVPDPLRHAYLCGTLALNQGDLESARSHLKRAVTVAPTSGRSWLTLAMIGPVPEEDGAAMLALEDVMASAPLADRGAFFYALGKSLAEQGDADRAFTAYATGASAERVARGGAGGIDRDGAAGGLAWTSAQLAALPSTGAASTRTIIVTGLPRSGTTLIEQILAAHSAVVGGEELSILRQSVSMLGGSGPDTIGVANASRLTEARTLYDHLLAQRFGNAGRVVDKTLLGGRHMGVIAALMPDAPIIWVRRDPLDNAWSIFHTYFQANLSWTFDLAEIAEQMRLEDALHAHWRALRPERILTVDYAALVSDPAKQIPRIVEHCGLALEQQQLRPERSGRTVTTASVTQVRTPINTRAIGAAQPFRKHLQPFLDAYGRG
ncbi:Sulfotransferase family protein [Sphingomonas guangdongensis]|uniref:Sulfotransferase family protein n=1 Tax=Sphingomonas guangdongensis TaxID=1141890 RepID=A0A285QGI1_9SPHN|nr:sulfotransferase [Sphingomonas guangdongensis]SOB81050.1 Sulfotransferase family protein [Sphingomonas guangdongensis]